MNPHGHVLATAALFVPVVLTVAPSRAEESVAESRSGPTEEITVTGKSMAAARKDLYLAQERVFTTFNALNSDNQYDIHCGYRQPTGSLIRERVCEANFVGDATSAEALAWMMRRGLGAVPAWAVILRKKKLLHKEMVRIAEQHPEFLAALEELAETYELAEALKQKRRSGG